MDVILIELPSFLLLPSACHSPIFCLFISASSLITLLKLLVYLLLFPLSTRLFFLTVTCSSYAAVTTFVCSSWRFRLASMVALVLVEMIKQLSSSSSSMLSLDYSFLLLLLSPFFVILLFDVRFAIIFSSSITSTEAS